ncbi:hypothetical protein IscW_ISCW005301, partial [Ixodes scapularis]
RYNQYLWDQTCDVPVRSKHRLKETNAAIDESQTTSGQNLIDGLDATSMRAAVESTLSTNITGSAAGDHALTESEKTQAESSPHSECDDSDWEGEELDRPPVTTSSDSSDPTESESSCASDIEDETERSSSSDKDTDLVRVTSF